ncbi:hypothetical protein Egran_06934 [Elaphomyces granulatus]|uniref:Sugar phosphate transporter domain-containing protein n=1 Tax=Elaphomyces granulatus TaxID=519963 RepID=A0A232LMB4_9EURO|nr:hypothetical protein Egran_06934 [Elaphomyces granulatus]
MTSEATDTTFDTNHCTSGGGRKAPDRTPSPSLFNDGLDVPSSATHERYNIDETKESWLSTAAAAAYATIPKWLNVGIIVSLIFGGCCGNVFALEAIIKDEPSSGPLITFVQFLTAAFFTLPGFLSFSAGPQALFLRPRAIPLTSWLISTAFFVTVNLLNNWAFAYSISVPLHIIIRSAGPVASMIVGCLYNAKRYSRLEIFAVSLLTIGAVWAALADADAKGRSMKIGLGVNGEGSSLTTFLTGFAILFLAMILAAFQGVYMDRLYAKHGNNHWREALLYSHLLSLPFFLPTYPQMSSHFRSFLTSPPLLSPLSKIVKDDGIVGSNATSHFLSAAASTATPVSEAHTLPVSISTASTIISTFQGHPFIRSVLAQTPVKIFYLLINAVTQYLCIRGVYLLAARSTSLSVAIVLNIRKIISLLLSIYIFENVLATGVLVGAILVFLGGGLYLYCGNRARKTTQQRRPTTQQSLRRPTTKAE